MKSMTVRPPDDDAFGGAEFMEAPAIEQVAEMLRERHNLPVSITFSFLWKRKGGKKGGASTRGWCVKLSGPAKYYAGKDFLVWLAADACREANYTPEQYVALIYHELLFADVSINEDTFAETPVMRRVDFEGFLAEVRDYGAWEDGLAAFVSTVEQAPLFGAPDGPGMARAA